ncbi:MAG: hypothetical protein HY593_05560, partial [Candidatus Omnitrophica bacterium]|nr:hypothetical protein [Candidatus Omnitrophota bacterium]
MSRYPYPLKIIALSLVLSFAFQELSHAGPLQEGPNGLARPPHFFKISPELGRITEVYRPSSLGQGSRVKGEETIILIQDAHTNPSAQIHVSKILEELIKKYKLQTVFIEGG